MAEALTHTHLRKALLRITAPCPFENFIAAFPPSGVEARSLQNIQAILTPKWFLPTFRILERCYFFLSFLRDLPGSGIKPTSPALAGGFFTAKPSGTWEAPKDVISNQASQASSTREANSGRHLLPSFSSLSPSYSGPLVPTSFQVGPQSSWGFLGSLGDLTLNKNDAVPAWVC